MGPHNKRYCLEDSASAESEAKKQRITFDHVTAIATTIEDKDGRSASRTNERRNENDVIADVEDDDVEDYLLPKTKIRAINNVLRDNHIGSANGRVSGIGEIKYNPENMFNFKIIPYPLVGYDGYDGSERLWYRAFVNNILVQNPTIELAFDIVENAGKYDKYYDIATKRHITEESNTLGFEFTKEQIVAYDTLIQQMDSRQFSTIMIVGPAGCGKTICLQQILADTRINFQYITMQTNLAENAKLALRMKQNNVTTVAAFCMKVLGIKFHDWLYFHHLLISTNPDVIESSEFCKKLPISSSGIRRFFEKKKNLPEKVKTKELGESDTNVDDDPPCDEYEYHVLCLDEFSMIASNLILLIKKICQIISSTTDINIAFLLCGDAYQIEPLFITKRIDEDDSGKQFHVQLQELLRTSRHYIPPAMSYNAKSIVGTVDLILPFCTQMRNDNATYQTFISTLRRENSSKTCRSDILHFFGRDICSNHAIEYHYPIEALKKKPKLPDFNDTSVDDTTLQGQLCDYTTAITDWLNEYIDKFTTFRFFAFTNSEAHQINLSLFSSVFTQILQYNATVTATTRNQEINQPSEDLATNEDYVSDDLLPKIVPIFFTSDMNVSFHSRRYHMGLFDNPRLPIFPLIFGMQYKLLEACMSSKLKRGQIVTLVDIIFKKKQTIDTETENIDDDGVNKITGLVVIVELPYETKIMVIGQCHFRMNLFRTDNGYYFDPQHKSSMGGSSHTRSLYGFPMQLNIGDTIRGSIGITVNTDIYANLNGSSISEIYVLLSRTRNCKKIKGLYV
ncbi:Helicase-2 protein [Dolichomitus sp. PSUC_FEM 10030005]|nr:Helicase-2 protein [Dolichomitus sp. PSUC_FEM 10030005]